MYIYMYARLLNAPLFIRLFILIGLKYALNYHRASMLFGVYPIAVLLLLVEYKHGMLGMEDDYYAG